MEPKYTRNTLDNGAIMYLYGEIGVEIDALYFASEMEWHKRNGRDITVYINSPGGSVFAGYAIIQSIIDTEANTHIVGLAASMAGVCALFGKRITCNDFALLMIHSASNGQEDLLEMVNSRLKKIIFNRSKYTEAEINELFKKDSFIDSSTMIEKGLVDEVISTEKRIDIPKGASTSDLFNIFNKIIVQQKEYNMQKIKALLKLGKDATEAEVEQAIVDLQNKLKSVPDVEKAKSDAAEAARAEMQTELNSLKDENQVLAKQLAEQLIDGAVDSGKIKSDDRAIWLENAEKNFKGTKAMLDTIEVKRDSVQNYFDANARQDVKGYSDEEVVDLFQNRIREAMELQRKNPKAFADLEQRFLNLSTK